MGYRESFEEICDWRDELHRSRAGMDLIDVIKARLKGESDGERQHLLRFILAQEYDAQGDRAAAKAVFHEDPTYQVHEWHRAMRETHDSLAIIEEVEERIRRESDRMKLKALNFVLGWEYSEIGDHAAYEAISLRMADADPDNPMWLISLAAHKQYAEQQPEAAMPIIDRAIDVAFSSGTFRRHALAVKARIALELKQYPIVEDMLRQILQLKFGRGNADIGVERDILDRLPPGSIDAEVARQYDEFCRAHGKLPAGG